jgi:hypothetical protein
VGGPAKKTQNALEEARLMTRDAAISIAVLALVTLVLIMLLGRHSGGASLPDHLASTVDKRTSQAQADEINQARECTATCSAQ